MTQEQNPIPLGEPEWDRSLWRMVAASGVLHVIVITLLIVVPYTFLHRPPALKSYTVDLIAPDHVGGTNMIAGGKGRAEGPPMAAAGGGTQAATAAEGGAAETAGTEAGAAEGGRQA
jgi:hypothetical protein